MANKRVNVEGFIEAVRQYPFLYNKREKEFKNIYKKESCWTEIGSQFGLSGEAAQKKWKNLRDRYIKQKNAIENRKVTGTGLSEVPKVSWAYYELMDTIIRSTLNESSLVTNVLVPVPGEAQMSDFSDTTDAIALNVHSVEDPSVLGFAVKQEPNDEIEEESLNISSPCSTVSERNPNTTDLGVPSHSQRPESRKRRHSLANEDIVQAVVASAEVLKSCASSMQQTSKQEDTVSTFARNVECRLRSLSKRKQLYAMHEIENILFKSEIEEIDDV